MTTVPQNSNKRSSFRSMTIFLQVHRILQNKTACSSVHLPDPKHLQKVRMWKGIWANSTFVNASMRIQKIWKSHLAILVGIACHNGFMLGKRLSYYFLSGINGPSFTVSV